MLVEELVLTKRSRGCNFTLVFRGVTKKVGSGLTTSFWFDLGCGNPSKESVPKTLSSVSPKCL
ncbi:hypothetical protein L195_g052871 [Trifolium pratense]|uniref:Uncharacterized protein n=1 Tax=Trifolium pratense TaxID=57577 RepID=A0A2K3K7H4_TRIPR|nr:hypothetical protein L195_g052871 [Trifolium pratense]